MKNVFPTEELKKQRDYSLNSYKTAKQWADEYLSSEEGKLEIEKWDREARDYIVFGVPTTCLNEELLDEMRDFIEVEELSTEQFLEIYENTLTEEEIIQIKNQ
jgi:hypothetical protein